MEKKWTSFSACYYRWFEYWKSLASHVMLMAISQNLILFNSIQVQASWADLSPGWLIIAQSHIYRWRHQNALIIWNAFAHVWWKLSYKVEQVPRGAKAWNHRKMLMAMLRHPSHLAPPPQYAPFYLARRQSVFLKPWWSAHETIKTRCA